MIRVTFAALALAPLPTLAEPCIAEGPWDKILSCHFYEICAEGAPCTKAELAGEFKWRDVPDGVRAFPMGPAAFSEPAGAGDWCGQFLKQDGWIKAELGESLAQYQTFLWIGTKGGARWIKVNLAEPEVTIRRGTCEVEE